MTLGARIRAAREQKAQALGRSWSLRQVAGRLGVEPSYLSKVERDEEVPSEALLGRLCDELGENKDVWLALSGRVSADLREIIAKRPELFATLIRELKDAPDNALLRVAREVRDGNW